MDLKVSRKEKRYQPSGPVEVLVSNIFDIYPIYDTVDSDLIVDCEILDDDRVELLDRAMFAAVKQRGADPLELDDGIQWAEALLREVSPTTIMNQVQAAVQKEGPGVQVTSSTVQDPKLKSYLQFSISLTNNV